MAGIDAAISLPGKIRQFFYENEFMNQGVFRVFVFSTFVKFPCIGWIRPDSLSGKMPQKYNNILLHFLPQGGNIRYTCY